jgi:hypothetical protein
MRILILGLIMALVAQTASAQKPPIKFGNVPIEDLKMTVYSKDSSAAAVVLADYGESSLTYNQDKGFMLNYERIRRVKILTKDGLEWANYRILLYENTSGEEKLTALKAVTYNLENGKIVETKMKSDAVFREKYDENRNLLKMTLPNAKEGSIIEISYSILSDFIFNFQDWEFQSTIPVVWSEYRARIPEYLNYDKYTQGYIGLDINEHNSVPSSITLSYKERSGDRVTRTEFSNEKIDFQENRFRWAAKDVPAFKEEPFMTTYRDYISAINFELAFTKFPNAPVKNYMGSWDDVSKTYDEVFTKEIKGNDFLKRTVEEITAGLSTPEEKIGAIHHYVRSNFMWEGTSWMSVNSSIRKIVDAKKGNSAEINIVLASMLEKAGIDVSAVMLSTRDHGFVRETSAISSQFNYIACLASVGDKQVLLDATEKFLPVGVLPERCLNGRGLVISNKGHRWVNLDAPIKSRFVINADLSLMPGQGLKGKISMDRTGYYAEQNRKKYNINGEQEYIKAFLANHTWDVTKSEFQGATKISEPFKETHELVINDQVTEAGDMLYLNPFFIWRTEENPFKSANREYPVDFGSPFDRTYLIKVAIPDNYTVEELPVSKAAVLANNSGKLIVNVTHVGNVISITNTLQINRSLFTQVEYPNLREFYNLLVAKQSEQIVLKKK